MFKSENGPFDLNTNRTKMKETILKFASRPELVERNCAGALDLIMLDLGMSEFDKDVFG